MNVLAFHAAIAAVCPIEGVDSNRGISFSKSATSDQIAAAQALAASWVDPGNYPAAIEMWRVKTVLQQTAFNASQAKPAYQAAVAGKTNLLDAVTAMVGASANIPLINYWNHSVALDIGSPAVRTLAVNLGVGNLSALYVAAVALAAP